MSACRIEPNRRWVVTLVAAIVTLGFPNNCDVDARWCSNNLRMHLETKLTTENGFLVLADAKKEVKRV